MAQFKYTLLLMPNGPMKITGLPFDETLYKSEHTIDDEEVKVCFVCLFYFYAFVIQHRSYYL